MEPDDTDTVSGKKRTRQDNEPGAEDIIDDDDDDDDGADADADGLVNIGSDGDGDGDAVLVDNNDDVAPMMDTSEKGEAATTATGSTTASAQVVAGAGAGAGAAVATSQSTTKISSSTSSTSSQLSVSAASAAMASQLSATMGLLGLYSLLNLSVISGAAAAGGGGGGSGAGSNVSTATAAGGSGGGTANLLPTIEQVQQAANKSTTDNPPFCHLSKTDSAPQLKITTDSHRLVCKGGMRGYRMARGSHGISEGNYYYEVIILDPPPASEIASALPANVRLGKKLQQELQDALREEQQTGPSKSSSGSSGSTANHRKSSFGAHVRLGWSMRTGDLQAPVGYDRWSFAVRDIGGSKIHCSKREDRWGGEEFGPGDVVGCAISLVPGGTGGGVGDACDGGSDGGGTHPASSTGTGPANASDSNKNINPQQPQGVQNHIRFFKNGHPMGEFVISKGRREGGSAFVVPDGVYYPAISLYMGASVQVNFGPNFVCPPRKLPTGLKFQPVSSLCKPPMAEEEAVAKVTKERVFRKPDMQQQFLELVKAEVTVLQGAYYKQRTKHIQDMVAERKKRNLKIDDLENDEFYTPSGE